MREKLPALSCGLGLDPRMIKEFVNKTNGILVNPDDVNAIYEGMLQMIKNYNQYNSSNISEETSKQLGITTFGNKLTAIYQELCAE